VVRVPVAVREDLHCGTPLDLFSVFFHKKYIHSYNFYLSGSVNKFLNFCSLLSFLVSKNGDKTFSHFVNSGFPNFRSNYFWHTDFSWNKVVRVDSTAPINATRSEEVWKALKGNRTTKVATTKDIFLRGHYT